MEHNPMKRLNNQELFVLIEVCKEELYNNAQIPSEFISGDFIAGYNYCLKDIINKCYLENKNR